MPAVPLPHAGTSYNPPVDAHTELILRAHKEEESRLLEDVRWKEAGQAIKDAVSASPSLGAEGMVVDKPGEDVDEENAEELPPKKIPQRKTKSERRKALKARAERRLLAERAAKRRQLSFLNDLNAKKVRRMQGKPAQEEILQKQRIALREKLRTGLAGQKLGKYRVPEALVDVQLGDELSESLRGMKVYDLIYIYSFVLIVSSRLRGTFSKTVSSICSREP